MTPNYLLRTVVYRSTKRRLFRIALIASRAGIWLYPRDPWFVLETAKLAGRLKRGPLAIRAVRLAVEMNPEDSETRGLLIRIEVRFGSLASALRAAQEARVRGLLTAEGCSAIGAHLVEAEDPESALRWTEEALRLEPGRENALLAHADALAELGRKPEAEEIYRGLRESARDQWVKDEASIELAVVLFEQGREADGRALAESVRADLESRKTPYPPTVRRLRGTLEWMNRPD